VMTNLLGVLGFMAVSGMLVGRQQMWSSGVLPFRVKIYFPTLNGSDWFVFVEGIIWEGWFFWGENLIFMIEWRWHWCCFLFEDVAYVELGLQMLSWGCLCRSYKNSNIVVTFFSFFFFSFLHLYWHYSITLL
jgi:hypothetical protein